MIYATDYHYALDTNGQLVHINNAVRGVEYYCVNCKSLMIVKQGKVRAWHYAHKHTTNTCSFETYLHSLTKRKLYDWLKSSDSIKIGIMDPAICENASQCQWYDSDDCKGHTIRVEDIRPYYDCCEIEKPYKGYRADVLLYDSQNKYPSVLFEVCVSHPCSEEKINSGLRIVEIKVGSEDHIDSILKRGLFEHGYYVVLYNFKSREHQIPPSKPRTLERYTLFESKKMLCRPTNCIEYNQHRGDALLEVVVAPHKFESIDLYKIGTIVAKNRLKDLKSCNICKYHRVRDFSLDYEFSEESTEKVAPILCCLYKTYGLDKHCFSEQALSCPYYRCYKDVKMDEFIKECSPIEVWYNEELLSKNNN